MVLSESPCALITGGTRRIGAHLAMALAAEGYRLVLCYRSDHEAAAAAKSDLERKGAVSVRTTAVDVASSDQVLALADSIAAEERRLDLLIHNVGIYQPRPVWDIAPADWDRTIQTNLGAAFYCFHACRSMLEASRGLIVYLGFAGLDGIRADVDETDYHVSKTGILALTKSLGRAMAPRGVRVNMISPGQMENSIDLPEDSADLPMRRAGRLDELVHGLRFLRDNGYVTGVNIDIAGGHRL